MELIADGLLIAAAGTAALYCYVLSRRLSALKDLDKGLGNAIAGLSAQVDETRKSLASAKSSAATQSREMRTLTERAEAAAARLDMMLAALPEHRERPHRRPAATPQTPAKPERLRTSKVPDPRIAPADSVWDNGPSAGIETDTQEKRATAGGTEIKSALIARLRGLAQASAT
ncbi:hypothetical protein [Algicella marina]|uniref:Uncharacterized protein n=1 Tax=Algicella marina TaxID=2683284 RepID=A0A6P1T475_9RHOB|nr:hypothetical protein [Algicella marina]QHQ36807.1 hypothetical protein GO499_17285 [Algicella marina]